MCSPDVRNPNNTKQKKEESKERSAFRFAQGRSEYTKANVTKLVMLCRYKDQCERFYSKL